MPPLHRKWRVLCCRTKRRLCTADAAVGRRRALAPRSLGAEATWTGEALVIKLRYFAVLADAIIAAGFLFERRALPN